MLLPFFTFVHTYSYYFRSSLTLSRLSAAVQNERQPRNSAQVRQDQLEAELQHSSSEHGSVGCSGVGPAGMLTGATVSATHPAFTPIRPAHDGLPGSQSHRCDTVSVGNDMERRTARTSDSSEHGQPIAGMVAVVVFKLFVYLLSISCLVLFIFAMLEVFYDGDRLGKMPEVLMSSIVTLQHQSNYPF